MHHAVRLLVAASAIVVAGCSGKPERAPETVDVATIE